MIWGKQTENLGHNGERSAVLTWRICCLWGMTHWRQKKKNRKYRDPLPKNKQLKTFNKGCKRQVSQWQKNSGLHLPCKFFHFNIFPFVVKSNWGYCQSHSLVWYQQTNWSSKEDLRRRASGKQKTNKRIKWTSKNTFNVEISFSHWVFSMILVGKDSKKSYQNAINFSVWKQDSGHQAKTRRLL